MIKKISLNRYKITPVGWKQHCLVFVFWATGSITYFSGVIVTENKKLVEWFS